MDVTILENKQTNFDRYKLVKLWIYYKILDMGKLDLFSDKHIDILTNLYIFGGTSGKEDLHKFFDLCYDKELSKRGSENSIRNCFTLAREVGIIKRRKANDWKIDKSIMSENKKEPLYLKLSLTDYAI